MVVSAFVQGMMLRPRKLKRALVPEAVNLARDCNLNGKSCHDAATTSADSVEKYD
jgi:hypothetical protein